MRQAIGEAMIFSGAVLVGYALGVFMGAWLAFREVESSFWRGFREGRDSVPKECR